MTDKKARVEQLLSMAWNSTSTARTVAIANQILELDPENVEALILKADNTTKTDEQIKFLTRAFASLENVSGKYKDFWNFAINERLAYTYFVMNKYDEAFKYCEEALKFIEENDDAETSDDAVDMMKLYYRILIERREWQKILELTMRDEDHSLAWAYARLISAWMLAPEGSRKICAGMFWDALILGANVPFYMLGYLEEPDDNSNPVENEEFEFALIYYDVLSVSDDFFRWFSRGTILFGLLSNRFNAKEREYMLDALDNLGGFEEYEKMSKILIESDDAAVIEMLAANKCLSD